MASASKDKPLKLRKLNEFRRRLPHVSVSALNRMLADIAEHGVPELQRRNSMREATKALIEADNPHGPHIVDLEMEMAGGGKCNVPAVNPFAYLYHAYRESTGCREFMNGVAAGCSLENPFRLIVYDEEIVPGRELPQHNKRKVWCMYLSFGEFLQVCHKEEAWFPLLARRSATVNGIAAGINQVYAKVLLLCWSSAQRHLHGWCSTRC